MWPDRRLLDLLRIEHPIIQAPMAGPNGPDLAIAVSEAGGLGSLPCAMLGPDQARAAIGVIRQRTAKPLNVNFFCHTPPQPDPARDAGWRAALRPFYEEFGLDPDKPVVAANRAPFDEAMCAVVEETRPEVVSFHFGLPGPDLLERVKRAGAVVLSSATTVAEARWLEAHGADAIIAQGAEAGGHRGMFLSEDAGAQAGLFALLPQVADAVRVPVAAAGGVADARGIVASLALGASGVQIGTAYLVTPEATTPAPHRAALRAARDDGTAITNVYTGRPARGIVTRLMREVGPMSPAAPAFPGAAGAVQPLRAAAEAKGIGDFSPLWAGQAAALAREMGAGELTRKLAEEALGRLARSRP
ncbi:2-nitropropane dioxygenase [Alsobacter soli]|uniref:Nitronate monooxygenase n=1 Tax=Alsobacter soli TaxID=2109933 RepID=A0A2T1HRY8_9HYPH|nr:nitronate monooxygenase [Alsobacter soli]PSC04412.1 2-nitropropane dioxygenase [Alsobacter soli]